MEEKFRIGDMEYTIHNGTCAAGDNLLCNRLPGVDQDLIHQWMRHGEANRALRRAADRIRPVTGACDHRVAQQLNQEAVLRRLSVSGRKVRPPNRPGAMGLPGAMPEPVEKVARHWWEDASRPLGPGYWEQYKLIEESRSVDEKGHKLALEIAGTSRVSLQGELKAVSDDGVIARYNLGRGGRYDDHRCQIAMENLEPGSYRLHLKLQDNGHGGYEIPLDSDRALSTCPRPETRGQWQTVLVPLVPRTYETTALQRGRDHCGHPAEGFIYLFLDGRLWREVAVREKGWFADVNLTMHKGNDHRPATCKADRTILVPYQAACHQPAIEICYAQVQWSWAQIEALGGMADNDPRLKKGPAPEAMETTEFPLPRLQPVDLSSYPHFDKGCDCVSGTDLKGDGRPGARPDLSAFRGSRLPVVYLHDALGIADSLVSRYKKTLTELRQTVADLPKLEDVQDLDPVAARAYTDEKKAYYAMAAFAHRLFFDPRATSTDRRPPRAIRYAKHHIDRDALENILQVKKRRKLKTRLAMIKKELVRWLNGRHRSQGKTAGIAVNHPDFIPVTAMLMDYANLNGDAYGLLWTKTADLVGFLRHTPGDEDHGLDIVPGYAQKARAEKRRDPGMEYLKKMLEPSHPLHRSLFPTQTQVDEFQQDYLAPDTAESPDGSGLFRKGAFAGLTKATPPPADRTAGDLIGLVNQASANFLLCFQPVVAEAAQSAKSEAIINPLIRLAKAADDPELAGLHIAKEGNPRDLANRGLLSMGAGRARFDQISRALGSKSQPVKSKPQGKTIPILNAKTGRPVGFAAANGKGPAWFNPPADTYSYKKWDAMWNARDKGHVVVSKSSGYAGKYYEAAKTAARAAQRVLPPLVAVLEAINFTRTAGAYFRDFETGSIDKKLRTYALISGFSLIYYTIDAIKAALGDRILTQALNSGSIKIGDIIFKTTVPIMGGHVVVFNAWGAGVTGLTGLLAFYKMAECIGNNDYDAAKAFGVAGGAYFGLAVAKIGAAHIASAGAMGVFASGAGPLATFGPWCWAFLVVGIGAFISAEMLKDSKLEIWAKFGPFAKDLNYRRTREFNTHSSHFAYAFLLGELLRPNATIRYADRETAAGPTDVIVEVNVSLLDGYSSEIFVQTSAQKIGAVIKGVSHERPEEPDDYEPHLMGHYRIEQDEREDGALCLRYYYKGLSALQNRYRWRVRVRHVINKDRIDVSLPPVAGKCVPLNTSKIEKSEPGWVYAEL